MSAENYIPIWDNTDTSKCCFCHTLLPKEMCMRDAIFTVVPCWRDWRPVRYVCEICLNDKQSMNTLKTIDSIYLQTIPVFITPEWLKHPSFSIKNPQINEGNVQDGWKLYTTYDDTTCWLRPWTYNGSPLTFGLMMQSDFNTSYPWMDITEFMKLNPSLPPFKFNFIYNHGKTIEQLKTLMLPDQVKYLEMLEPYLDSTLKG